MRFYRTDRSQLMFGYNYVVPIEAHVGIRSACVLAYEQGIHR